MTQSRTHTCGELRLANAGETVTLVGWMENIREVGNNFAFLVLRDFYGTTQVVIENEEMMNIVKPLNKESTISVTGIVRERTSKNPKLPTGDIEIAPTEITVLGRCRYNELPFEINHSREADESQRLKYRYLDLRNPEVKANIILRCNVVSALRTAMTEHGFLEITTPILTASSPEGARDYLVPARKHPGKFYALPQAPQQFKQLLMTAGFDRYFQIAPCFRDEDARGDRSPGEFYQMDMEMAFASQEDVFAVIEDVLPPIFAKYGTYNIASSAPFARIPYRQAMEEFGSDKPDLRIDLRVKDVTDILQNCGFGPFENNIVKAVPVSNCKLARKAVDKLCADVEVQAGQKPYWFKVDESGAIAGGIAKFINADVANFLKPLEEQDSRHYYPMLRKGEVWLNFAEASNEVWGPKVAGPGCSMSAYDVIRVIREKSGGITNTTYLDEMAGTPESFRKLIQNERRIEFAFENQRFWDLRRWLLPLNESILGMEVTRKEDSSENFEVKLVEERPLNDIRYYYLPLPYDELQKNPNLKNNKGW